MAKYTLKIFRCEHCKIFKVCLAIFQHYDRKGNVKIRGSHLSFTDPAGNYMFKVSNRNTRTTCEICLEQRQ